MIFADHAEGTPTSSLFSYTGHVMIPSAYIPDGRLGLHYSSLGKTVAPFHRGESDNQIYSLTLGFLPFLEGYFSVYVCPDINVSNIYDNYGSLKVRSPGLKIRVVNEREYIPALAVGIFDPDIREFGVEASCSNVSSAFVVASKQIDIIRSSVSLGYGITHLKGHETRLRGVFGGMTTEITRNISLLMDYDSEFWSMGGNLRWRGWDVMLAYIDGRVFTYRIGRTFDLLDRT